MFRNVSDNKKSLLNKFYTLISSSNFKRTNYNINKSLIDEYDWFRPSSDQSKYLSVSESSLESLEHHQQQQEEQQKHYETKFESYFDYLLQAENLESIRMTSKLSPNSFTTPIALNQQDDLSNLSSLIDFYLQTNTRVQTFKPTSIKSVKLFQKSYYKEKIKGQEVKVASWRMKEKMKTVSAALVLCLNIGVDPPDVVKTVQSSKLECWINITNSQIPAPKNVELIGAELQKQYERWQPRARYKHCLDPTSEDVKKLCVSLRKNAKDERVLFHYNGHGVPRPTINGEIWVFNKEFTQYIPLSLYEVQTWMGTPSLYVWDCSNAGLIVQSFLNFEQDRESEFMKQINEADSSSPSTIPNLRDSIHLAACGSTELLPQHPDLPLDLFTACLTTPIKTALYWYVTQKKSCQLIPGLTLDLLEKIPGAINDRRTMMGELNWIFTAITDTIAWNVLDSDLFQKLFRQDLLVASLFRNFLLAERIMKSFDCSPVSHPCLPSTNEHPLWQSWDLALDMCISQLPQIFTPNGVQQKDFVSCGFFTEQIEIFDVWLKYNVNSQKAPEQLPVVLQVLLSQQHRLKALELLAKFIDFGPWAVSAALSVGIFPYVLKLLTTQPRELRPLLTFIWAKILAVDKSCQTELVKDNGHVYFIHVLSDNDVEPSQKVYSAFVLACLVDNFPIGQESAKQNHLIAACCYLLTDDKTKDYENPLLRQWICLCLGLCWQNYPDAKWEGVRNNAHLYLIKLISDPVAEVRAAAVFALGTYIGCGEGQEGTFEQAIKIDSEIANALIKETDIVFLVRKELVVALFNYINRFVTSKNSLSLSGSNSTKIDSAQQSMSRSQSTSTITSSSLTSNRTITNTSSFQTVNENTISENTPETKRQQFVTSIQNSSLNRSIMTNSTNVSSPALRTPSTSTPLTQSIAHESIALSNSKKHTSNVFLKVWMLMIEMLNDPYPDVAGLAQQTVDYFLHNLTSFDPFKQDIIRKQLLTNNLAQLLPETMSNNSTETNQKPDLNTEFVAWSNKYFLKPLLSTQSQNENNYNNITNGINNNINNKMNNSKNEPLLINHKIDLYTSENLDEHCKLLYNYKMRRLASEWKEPSQMDEIIQIKHQSYPIHVKFNPNNEQIFVADTDNLVTVYDNSSRSKILSFSTILSSNYKKPKPVVIRSFKLINTQHEPIVLTGSDDRVVKFFKPDLQNLKQTQLLSAFTAFNYNQKKESTIESGLIVDWDELNEILICAGDTDYIRVWDMNKELYKDFITGVRSCVTSLSSGDNYTIAGFGDGSVKMFDFRMPNSNPILNINHSESMSNFSSTSLSSSITPISFMRSNSVLSNNDLNKNFRSSSLYSHNTFVLKVYVHKHSNKLISSGISGDIVVYDLRSSTKAVDNSFNNEKASALECHSYNELIAVANNMKQNESIKIYNLKGKELSCIKHHDGFIGKRLSTVSCMDWSVNSNELLFGSCDNFITVFRNKDNSTQNIKNL